jgi:ABC-type branched-subunit amino acid transport system substrate-binding protein
VKGEKAPKEHYCSPGFFVFQIFVIVPVGRHYAAKNLRHASLAESVLVIKFYVCLTIIKGDSGMSKFNRRNFLQTSGALLASTAVTGVSLIPQSVFAAETVKLGLLHSLSGTIAIAEASLVDAEKLAIAEINAAGGVMGRQIEVVIEDGASDNPTFAEKAKKLLQRDKVAAIIGCYTSASRKAVLPALNQNKGLLFYPTYYEGQEQDKYVMYPSQEATQSVIAAIEWMAKQQGKTFFLVGSDYIYPRLCNKIAKPTVARMGGTTVGEEYVPLGHTEFSSIINKIKAAKPDWIYSTVVGLWKMAVEKAKSFEVDKVIAAAAGIELDAPEGKVTVHATNHHVAKRVRIGKARPDGQFDIVFESAVIQPNPFPKL